MLTGRCYCGKVQYEFTEQGVRHALCHCRDCQRHAGAPVVGWALVPMGQLKVKGKVTSFASSENGRREFCATCGTSLFYRNAVIFPAHVDVQSATLDDPNALPPQAQIQTAERIGWMTSLHDLPSFERYPPAA
jgi:hypothetical protein